MFGLVACGNETAPGECGRVCERANACALNQRVNDVDCVNYCPEAERVSKAANCDAERQAHFQCWTQNIGEICNADWVGTNWLGTTSATFTGCDDSANTWNTCLETYCATDAAAGDPSCPGYAAIVPF